MPIRRWSGCCGRRPGRLLGRRLGVLRSTRARTGRPHELVTPYVRTGDTVWILVGQPEHKSWWRNLRAPGDVTLWLAGADWRTTSAGMPVARGARPHRPRDLGDGVAGDQSRVPVARHPPGPGGRWHALLPALVTWVDLDLVETRASPDSVLLTRYETRR